MPRQIQVRRSEFGVQNERQDRIYPIFLRSSEAPVESPEYRKYRGAIIKTTAEAIVREHRIQNSESRRQKAESMENRANPKPGPFKVSWYNAVNWNAVFHYGCWIGVAFAIGYLIIAAFVPFFALISR